MNSEPGRLTIERASGIGGSFRPPSDKSLTHRAYLLAAIASTDSVVTNPLRGEDCESTLSCLNKLGLRLEWISATEVRLMPASEWTQPNAPLDCGNSGTTMRLLAGLVASRSLDVTMIGDASLSRRPMKRIAVPLRAMGATVEGDTPPLHIGGRHLNGIAYASPVASGQIKSCTLLAGLRAQGETVVAEPSLSRDHTERMLRALGADLVSGVFHGVSDEEAAKFGKTCAELEGQCFSRLRPGHALSGFRFSVPGDISSSAFLMVAAALLPGDGIVAKDLNINPSRTGILDVLKAAGLTVECVNQHEALGEPIAGVSIRRGAGLKAFEIKGDLVPRLIDEIPVLAVLATQCEGTTMIRDASELRVKESDRIEVVVDGLRRMGAQVETFPDGMAITGPTPLQGIQIDAGHDHRIAMAFAIAGLIADGRSEISGAESIATSYPDFVADLRRLAHF